MTRLGITFKEVEETAEEILSKGENPTIEKIRRVLGTGSNSTIAKHLHDWRANRLMATTDHLPAPHLPPDSVHAAVNHVWEKIRNESDVKIKTSREEAQREVEIAQTERNQAIVERDRLQQDLDNSQKRLNQVSADKEILTLDLKALQQEHLLLQEKYKNIESEYNLFKQESNNKITLLQSIYEKESEDKKAIIVSIQQSHEASINKLIESHEYHRQQHMVDIDSHKVEKQQLNKIIEKLTTEDQTIKEELVESRMQIKMLSSERDSIKQESNKKDKILENNHSTIQAIQLIRNEIEKLNDLEIKNEIFSKIGSLDKRLDSHDERLLSILNSLVKSKEIIEDK